MSISAILCPRASDCNTGNQTDIECIIVRIKTRVGDAMFLRKEHRIFKKIPALFDPKKAGLRAFQAYLLTSLPIIIYG